MFTIIHRWIWYTTYCFFWMFYIPVWHRPLFFKSYFEIIAPLLILCRNPYRCFPWFNPNTIPKTEVNTGISLWTKVLTIMSAARFHYCFLSVAGHNSWGHTEFRCKNVLRLPAMEFHITGLHLSGFRCFWRGWVNYLVTLGFPRVRIVLANLSLSHMWTALISLTCGHLWDQNTLLLGTWT